MSRPRCERCDKVTAEVVVALRGVFRRTLVCRLCADSPDLIGHKRRKIKRGDYSE